MVGNGGRRGPDVHILSYIGAGCVLVSIALLALAVAAGHGSDRRRRLLGTSGKSMLLAIVILGSLVVAQRPVCHVLGGDWVGERQACRNEWGGNGSNDSSEGVGF
jgi:hypothetical protein